MKINRLSLANSLLLIIETYAILMITFSNVFRQIAFKVNFFSGVGVGLVLLQMFISILNIILILIYFRKEFINHIKQNILEQLIVILSFILYIVPINIFIKILLICIIYLFVEIIQLIFKRKKIEYDNSFIIILLSTILGILLIINFIII